MEPEIEKITTQIIIDNFELEEISNEKLFEKIRERLIDKIEFLLNHDFEKLLSILYRVDVSEEKAKDALSFQSTDKPAELLADLIIQRQIEKAKTRMQYKSDQGDL